MSWLFKSFQASDDDIVAESQFNCSSSSSECVRFTATENSALGDTLVVAAANSFNSSSNSSSRSLMLQGIRNDLAEIGGGLRNGFSILSVNSNKAFINISRFASNLLPFQRRYADDEDDEEFEDEFIDDDTPGVTDEVLNFVAAISSRPEYWTEFPLALDDTGKSKISCC